MADAREARDDRAAVMDQARRWSFYLALGTNGAILVLNLWLTATALWQQQRLGALSTSLFAGVNAIIIWLIVANERRLQLKIATAESYLLEQHADTTIKQGMAEQIRRHGAVVQFDAPPTTKARPN